jgi:SAM-dependent methyltransferase
VDRKMTLDEKARWNRKYSEGSHTSLYPDLFLVRAYDEFLSVRPPGKALDVAGGPGRHALWLADRGWQVKLIDISEVGIEAARKNIGNANHAKHSPSTAMKGSVSAEVLDLNSTRDLGSEQYDLILVFFYLQRELFPALISALKPDGLLIYKTFNTESENNVSEPSEPAFLLKPNELLRAFQSLRILHYHEALQGKCATELVARK